MMNDQEKAQQLTLATTSLREWLEPLTYNGSAHTVTRLITSEVTKWANDRGYHCELETVSGAPIAPPKQLDWPISIDLTGMHPSGLRLAIEIDRADNPRSLAKLAFEADRGAIAIWVRWASRCRLALPGNVGLVELRTYRRSVPGTNGRRYSRGPGGHDLAPPMHSSPPSRYGTQPTLFDL
jgi:hypothetical protein